MIIGTLIQMMLLAAALFLYSGQAIAAQNDDVLNVVGQINTALGNISGLHTTAIGNTVVLEGEIAEPSQMERIARIAASLDDLTAPSGKIAVRNMTVIAQKAKDELAAQITKELGAPGLSARFINDTLFVEGDAENDFVADRSVTIASSFFRTTDNGWNKMSELARVPAKSEAAAHSDSFTSPIWGKVTIVDIMRVKPHAKK